MQQNQDRVHDALQAGCDKTPRVCLGFPISEVMMSLSIHHMHVVPTQALHLQEAMPLAGMPCKPVLLNIWQCSDTETRAAETG